MIIVLKEADFSANNIGKIEIEREFNKKTIELLSKYSRTFSEEEKAAVDDFIVGLKSSNIMDKITCLLMPVLASNLNEAMINAVDYNVMGALNPTYWSFRNGGIANLSETYNNEDARVNISAYGGVVPASDSHFLFYNSEPYENSTRAMYNLPTRRNVKVTFYDSITSAADYAWLQGSNYYGVKVDTQNWSNGYEQFIFGVKDSYIINIKDSSVSVKKGTNDGTIYSFGSSVPSTIIDDVSFCGAGNALNKAHSLLSFGYALTDAEQTTYNTLVKELMAKFKIA